MKIRLSKVLIIGIIAMLFVTCNRHGANSPERETLYQVATLLSLMVGNYDGQNTPGWHFHFISFDRLKGGHLLELCPVSLSHRLKQGFVLKSSVCVYG